MSKKVKERLLIALDGRSASGKTTLAAYLQENLPCEVIHMDDFFLPIEKREDNWMSIPGGNIDFDRFIREVMLPLQKRETCVIRPFDCKKQEFGEECILGEGRIVLLEGAYSCHPKLWDYFDFHAFKNIDSKVQRERIRKRNGEEGLLQFESMWIPMEEQYFSAYDIEGKCEIHF